MLAPVFSREKSGGVCVARGACLFASAAYNGLIMGGRARMHICPVLFTHQVLQGGSWLMATTTFGYNPMEDRVWMACSMWEHRLWITRRCAQEVMQAVCRVLEQSASSALGDDAPARAAAEHDAAINRPSVTSGPAMQTGRDDAPHARSAPVMQYLLCTSARVSAGAQEAGLSFQTPEGELSIAFDREGLHRWLRGMFMVLQHADWNLPSLPEWVTRSYLPEALRAILTQPVPGMLQDEWDEEDPPA